MEEQIMKKRKAVALALALLLTLSALAGCQSNGDKDKFPTFLSYFRQD